jgi:hypothetical protein
MSYLNNKSYKNNDYNNGNKKNGNKKSNKSNVIKKKTFLILTKHIDNKIFRNIFNSKYWKQSNINVNINTKKYKNNTKNQENYVDFLYCDDDFFCHKIIPNLKTNIRNVTDDVIYTISDKNKLYDNFKKIEPSLVNKYMMKQYSVDISNKNNITTNKFKNIFKNNTTWILKPVDGFKGYGVKVVNNYDDMIKHFDEYRKKKDRYQLKRLKGTKPWVIAKYIDNPLLYKGKKFHIRLNLMYIIVNKTYGNNNKNNKKYTQGYLFNGGAIARAKNKYISKNYHDKNIHNTHHINKDYDIKFPKNFIKEFGLNKTKKVMKDIQKISKIIFKILDSNNAGCYSDTINCFNTIGIDIMIDDNFNVKLLECNSKKGLIEYNVKDYFENIINIVMKNIYPNDI